MLIPGLLGSATGTSTYQKHARVPKLFRLRKAVLDILCLLSDAKYFKDDAKAYLILLYMESRTLFLHVEFRTMGCRKAADRKINNPNLRGSFLISVFYSECVALLTDLEKVRTVLN